MELLPSSRLSKLSPCTGAWALASRVVRSSAIYTGGQVALLAIGLVNAIVFSRLLGPSGRGVAVLAVLVIGTATAFATFGLTTSFTYFAGKQRFPAARMVGAMVAAAILLGGMT